MLPPIIRMTETASRQMKASGDGVLTPPVIEGIEFVNYVDEGQLDDVMRLVGQDLSEPYSIFTYRYFLHRWPQLCILAVPTSHDDNDVERRRRPIGCVVCKIDIDDDNDDTGGCVSSGINDSLLPKDKGAVRTGYIGMLAVEDAHRRSGIGFALVVRVIQRMKDMGCRSIRLETEVTNKAAMRLYEDRLGFIREELLKKYYLNWGDAYRLRLWLDVDDESNAAPSSSSARSKDDGRREDFSMYG